MHLILKDIDIPFIHLFQCFNFSFLYITVFSEQTIFFISWKTMIIDTHLYLVYFYLMCPCFYLLFFLGIFCIFYFYLFFYYFFISIFVVIYCCYFVFPYFRGNSFNSRAGLEFKEFRLFSTITFQKNGWTSMFFFPNIIVEKAWKSKTH